jgi:hypothetical protein
MDGLSSGFTGSSLNPRNAENLSVLVITSG